MLLKHLREQVVATGLKALERGIVHGTAGNFSIKDPETGLIAISPSGIPYPDLRVEDVVIVDERGKIHDGHRKPSSETPMHTMVFRERTHVGAIVHTHSHFSTVVGCIRDELPPILTEVACVVGPRVPVTRYGITAMEDIARSIVEVLDDGGLAVLMRNHGLITFGQSFDEALAVAEVVEEAAKVYIHALAATGGQEPHLVPAELIPGMQANFRASYGQK